MVVSGFIYVHVSDPAYIGAVITIEFSDDKKIPFQPHPNVDKKRFNASREIALKGNKTYKLNDDLCVVRYRSVVCGWNLWLRPFVLWRLHFGCILTRLSETSKVHNVRSRRDPVYNQLLAQYQPRWHLQRQRRVRAGGRVAHPRGRRHFNPGA